VFLISFEEPLVTCGVAVKDIAFQSCISPSCGKKYALDEIHLECEDCGQLLDIAYDWDQLEVPSTLHAFDGLTGSPQDPRIRSGVWRFHSLLPFAPLDRVVTIGEGQTLLQQAQSVARYVGLQEDGLYLQYEGMNPSGSFKDNGMAAAFTHAAHLGVSRAACASTGNTSASLAAFCAVTRQMKAIIFIGSGKISFGKLSQALDYGALTVQIAGDFDDAMRRVREVASRLGIYLVNSVNPFRLEGQKTVMFRVLQALAWEVPDWIVVPGGNLGNSSAFGKAFAELYALGLIDRIPRLAVINAAGANTLYRLYEEQGLRWNQGDPQRERVEGYYTQMEETGQRAATVASAIEINQPVNFYKCLRALETCDGVVREVSDQEILDAKAQVGAGGLGCEPASAASVAGARKLRQEGVIAAGDRVVCVLTGHLLKDPDATVAYHTDNAEMFQRVLASRGVKHASFANRAVVVPNDLEKIVEAIEKNI
jgi:threonine synthase